MKDQAGTWQNLHLATDSNPAMGRHYTLVPAAWLGTSPSLWIVAPNSPCHVFPGPLCSAHCGSPHSTAHKTSRTVSLQSHAWRWHQEEPSTNSDWQLTWKTWLPSEAWVTRALHRLTVAVRHKNGSWSCLPPQIKTFSTSAEISISIPLASGSNIRYCSFLYTMCSRVNFFPTGERAANILTNIDRFQETMGEVFYVASHWGQVNRTYFSSSCHRDFRQPGRKMRK